jgi:hypothetical protein
MSTYGIEIPYPPEYDARQEQRDAQLEEIRKSLDWSDIRLKVLERMAMDMLTHEGAIGEVTDMLESAPIQSQWDLEAWLKWCAPRDAGKVGKAVMKILGEACLAAVQQADDVRF